MKSYKYLLCICNPDLNYFKNGCVISYFNSSILNENLEKMLANYILLKKNFKEIAAKMKT